ncbi:MAG: hypothetical protein JW940_28625 [Polyangiaceae bacterium]|nr:hypothetical protein [Polyangiaceae bacterium]
MHWSGPILHKPTRSRWARTLPVTVTLIVAACGGHGSGSTDEGAGQTAEGGAGTNAGGEAATGSHSGGGHARTGSAAGTEAIDTGGRTDGDRGGAGGNDTGGSGSAGRATGGSVTSGGSSVGGSVGAAGTDTGGGAGTLPLPNRCDPLPEPRANEPSRVVSSASALKAAVEGEAAEGETIFIADGTYLVEPMAVTVPHLTIRSESGHRENVTLDLAYTANDFDNGSIFNVWASGITVAHLTLTHAYNHAVHVTGTDAGDTTDTVLYDLHLLDNREQQVKLNADSSGQYGPRRGRLACSLVELTADGRDHVADFGGYTSCYTGGIDGHVAFDWVVEDNVFRGIYCEGREVDIAEHAVHFWSTSGENLVQSNVIIDCSRGVGLGMGDSTQADTVVRNNLLFASTGFAGFDTGIELEGVSNVTVVHNTMAGPMAIGINQRRETDTGQVANNILTGTSRAVMGSSGCDVSSNHTLADTAVFSSLDPDSPDFLRLAPSRSAAVVDAGLDLRAVCPEDIDGDARDTEPDVGADELVP